MNAPAGEPVLPIYEQTAAHTLITRDQPGLEPTMSDRWPYRNDDVDAAPAYPTLTAYDPSSPVDHTLGLEPELAGDVGFGVGSGDRGPAAQDAPLKACPTCGTGVAADRLSG